MKQVIYTHWFIPDGMAGFTPGPVTFIRPTHRNDAGLHVHEAVHRSQFWRSLGLLLPALYLLSRSWRLRLELEAYQAQMRVGGITLLRAAELLSANYRLDMTREQCLVRLLQRVE